MNILPKQIPTNSTFKNLKNCLLFFFCGYIKKYRMFFTICTKHETAKPGCFSIWILPIV